MLRGGQMVAVEDAHAVAGHGLRQQAAQVADNRLQPLGGVTHQFRGDVIFDALELVVHGGEGDGDVDQAGLVGGTDAALHVGDHQAHQVYHGGEEQAAGVLGLGVLLEQLVERSGRQGVLDGSAGHDAEGTLGEERGEDLVQQHGLPSGATCVLSS